MTTAQLYENVRLSMTVPKGSLFKKPGFGNRLGELRTETASEDTRRRAETYAKEALQWMLDVGRAETVEASAVYDDHERLVIAVEVVSPAGQNVAFSRFVEVADVQQ